MDISRRLIAQNEGRIVETLERGRKCGVEEKIFIMEEKVIL